MHMAFTSKQNQSNGSDPSCSSHPFHSLALALFEGSKKSQKHLKDCGSLFFLYDNQYDPNKLNDFIQYLQNQLIISDVKNYIEPEIINYHDLLKKMNIQNKNKVYVINSVKSCNIVQAFQSKQISMSRNFREYLSEKKPNLKCINSKEIFNSHTFNKPNSIHNDFNNQYPLYPITSFATSKLPKANNYDHYISIDIGCNISNTTQPLNLILIVDICTFKSKANICIQQICETLQTGDKFAIISFDANGKILVSIDDNSNIDFKLAHFAPPHSKPKLCETYMKAVELFEDCAESSSNSSNNRIMIISDINSGPDDDKLYALNERYSELKNNPIYCSFVALCSWTSFDIDKIYATKGSNYFCIAERDEIDEIKNKMKKQFIFMRSAMFFDLELEIKCENDCKIDKMYGNKRILNMKTKTFAYELWNNENKNKMSILRVKLLNKRLIKENNVINDIRKTYYDCDYQKIQRETHFYAYIDDKQFIEDNYYEIKYEFDLMSPTNNINRTSKTTQNVMLLNEWLSKFNHLTDEESIMSDFKDNCDENEVIVTLRFTDVNGKRYNVPKTITFDNSDNRYYYSDFQIRKAILLAQYTNILRVMVANPNIGLYEYVKYEFIPYFAKKCEIHSHWMKHELEILQEFMEHFQNNEDIISFVCKHEDVINKHNDIKHMIIGYNPLRISSNNNIKCITHPIDLYRSAYDEGFINDKQLNFDEFSICNYDRYKSDTLITKLQILLKMQKYFLLILIPSYIEFDNIYLNKECILFNPIDNYHNKDLDKYAGKISFIYKQKLYFDTRLNAKDCKDIDLHIKELNKKVLCTNNQNINININPILHWLIIGCNSIKLSRLELLIFGFVNKYSDTLYVPFDIVNLMHVFYGRKITFENGNNLFNELGMYQSISTKIGNQNINFSDALTKMLFLCNIEFTIPYNKDIINSKYKCGTCNNLVIEPTKIKSEWIEQNPCFDISICDKNNNVYCKQCITDVCPICFRDLNENALMYGGIIKHSLIKDDKLCKEMNDNIPTTIYEQIKKQ